MEANAEQAPMHGGSGEPPALQLFSFFFFIALKPLLLSPLGPRRGFLTGAGFAPPSPFFKNV